MRALQYIYTSWRNGGSSQKGYMIYSKSDGITDAECAAIKDVMQYRTPRELPMTPSEEEIKEEFPYSFAFFTLPGGRACVAQSTYLGQDYSGRYGNYIIYALVMNKDDLTFRPSLMFAEPYIKTAMTQEELDAPSPVPPLPALNIHRYGDIINDEELIEFLSDREEEFAKVLACVIEARDAHVPFYINDTRENLVLWAAAVQRVLPLSLALNFHFTTYAGDHERLLSQRLKDQGIDFSLTGVRPDTGNFSYAVECLNRRQIVLDLTGGQMSADIAPSLFEKETAAGAFVDFEEADAFSDFVERSGITQVSSVLRSAYLYYAVLEKDHFDYSKEHLLAVLRFGMESCQAQDNEQVGDKLISKAQGESWELSWEEFQPFWQFICTYTSYRAFTLYDLLIDLIYLSTENAADPDVLLDELDRLRGASPQCYEEFLNYLNTPDSSDQLMLYLRGHTDVATNLFYLKWILHNYRLSKGLEDRQPICGVAKCLLDNISQIRGCEAQQAEILLESVFMPAMFESVLNVFIGNWSGHNACMDKVCDYFMSLGDERSEEVSTCIRRLGDMPAAAPIAARMSVRQIRKAKDPQKTFWELYEQRIRRNLPGSSNYAASMVDACLEMLDDNDRVKAAVRMVRELDDVVVEKIAVAQALIDIFESCSVKSLMKLDETVLQDAYLIGMDAGVERIDKLCAVTMGTAVKEGNNARGKSLSLKADIEPVGITLLTLSKGDYEFYVNTFFEEFLYLVLSAKDVGILMRLFYSRDYFSVALSELTSILKKMHKKNIDRWDDLVCWLSVYAINTPDEEGSAVYDVMLKYLKGADEEDLRALKGGLARHKVSAQRSNRFLQEIARREDFGERIGNMFRRK